MDSPVSPKDEIWFLRVCHHISNAVYCSTHAKYRRWMGKGDQRPALLKPL